MSAPRAGRDRGKKEPDNRDDDTPQTATEGATDTAPADDAGDAGPADGAPDSTRAGAPIATAEADERYLRLAADFENFRRRKAQELADRSRYASEDAAKALLPVLDNLRRAVAHAADEGSADLVSGLELVVREFDAALERLGITAIEAAGQPFDPSVHDAIAGEESDSVDVDTVATEVQRGYRLHDRVLRPALVRVAHPATTRGAE